MLSNTRRTLVRFQSEVKEAKLNDAASGYCDIPGTIAICNKAVWKLGLVKNRWFH